MSAEKNGMFFHMDGKVSAVIGTHTKVLSADEKILPGGTAVITDAGRTGSINSVGGLLPDIEIDQYLTQIPAYSKAAWDKLELQGVVISIDRESGKAQEIKRLRIECEDPENE
jgi:calcineurin-like phosphoesterase